jgi:hypothetical protein
MASASDLKSAAETYRLGYTMGLYSEEDVVAWALETIAGSETAPPDWLCVVSEHRRAHVRKDWGGLAEPPSRLDLALARAPGASEIALILPPLFGRLLELVRRRERSDAEAVSGLYGLLFAAELPWEMKSGIYMLDYNLELAHDGVAAMDVLHQDIVDFLMRHSAPRTRSRSGG